MVGVGDVPCGQGGVLAGHQQLDILFLQLFQTAGGVPSAHIMEHEHGVQTAGHGQIEDLQLAVLGVLGLIFLVGQGNFFFFHVRTGADKDVVVVAPCRETEASMDFQVLDRVEDVGAVLDDLAEQAAQGVAALAQDAGRIEDGPVDASALEDADVLEHSAVRGEQLIGISLNGIHTAQFLDRRPAGDHRTRGSGSLLQPQGCKACDEGGGQRRTHAEHSGQRRSAAVEAAAKDAEDQTGQHSRTQQDVIRLTGAALTGAGAEALLHHRVVPLGGSAEQHPGVFFVHVLGEDADKVFVLGAERTAMLRTGLRQFEAALDRGQKDTVAQQCKEQPQRRNAGQKGEAGRLIVLRVQQSHSGLQKRSAGCHRGHGLHAGAFAPQPLQAVPHDGPAHSQRQRQEEQISGIEGRRGSYGVKAAQRADKALRGEAEVEQHQCKDAAQRTAQCKGRAHLVQPFPHLFRCLGRFFLFDRRFLDGCGLRSSRGSTGLFGRLCRRFLLRRLHRSRLVAVVQDHERQAHAVVMVRRRRAGRGCGRFLVVALAEELHRRGRMGLRCLIFCKHHRGHRHDRLLRRCIRLFFCVRFRCNDRNCRGALFRFCGLHRLGRLFLLRRKLCTKQHGFERLHFPVLVLLLRGARLVLDRLFPGRGLLFCRLFLRLGSRRLRRFEGSCGLLGLFRLRLGGADRLSGLRLLGPRPCDFLFQRQDQLQVGGFLRLLAAQLYLAGTALFGCAAFRLFGLFTVEQPAQQALGLFFILTVPPGHLLRDLGYTGGKKGAEFFFAGVELFLRHFLPLVILWHPDLPSLVSFGTGQLSSVRRAGFGSHTG